MATVADNLLTAEEFRRLPDPPDGSRQELVRGVVVAGPLPGFRRGVRRLRAGLLLHDFVLASRIGRVSLSCGVVTEEDPDTVRGPDVAFWSRERLPLEIEPEGYPEVAPDLCVEVLTRGRSLPNVMEKLVEYFARGVRLVWVLDTENRTLTVYRDTTEGKVLHEGATLDGEDVLPGFSCPVADFFR